MYLAKDRAKRLGLPFALTEDDIHIPGRCPVLGIVLRDSRKRPIDRRAAPNPNSPSLDRIVPSKGYVPGNVRVISHRANRLRGDGTLKEIERLYLYLMSEGAS